MAGKIFINYRRSLNLVEAQLLQKVLQRHFGKAGVFLDVSGLEGGEHWLHALEAQVDASVAMVSLIAKGWTAVADERGQRRLDNPDDFVRFEITRAFSRKIPVLPLRLDGADMPSHKELPPNIAQLGFQQAMLLRGETFDDDADRIAQRLKELIAPPSRRLPYWAVGVIAASALVAGLAAGPAVLTQLGMVQLGTDARLCAGLDRAQKQSTEAEAALKSTQEALSASQAKGEAARVSVAELTGQLKVAKERADRVEAELKQRISAAAPFDILDPTGARRCSRDSEGLQPR